MPEPRPQPFSTEMSARIPKPSADRPPLRTNAFEFAQMANTTLAPMFPYLQQGAIVPTTTLFLGGPGAGYGHFYHENTEEEVGLVLADHGALKGTGTVMIAPLLHGVQCFLKEPEDPESYLLITITQRQAEHREQTERVFFRCGCNEILFERRFDATPAPAHDAAANHVFTSLQESAETALAFGRDESLRTCKRCGKINPPFPVTSWGWANHAALFRAADRARRGFEPDGNAAAAEQA